MRAVRVGCSGWMYKDWRGLLYPPKLAQREWLRRYAEEFATVEINNTFYRLPKVSAVEGWVERTPGDFEFAVKVSRYLTHIKRLTEVEQGLDLFYERIEPLVAAGKLGPVLWQLPETFHRDDERLSGALRATRGRPGRHCFEFRHPSWFAPAVLRALRAGGAALVIGDDPRRRFQRLELTADWTYVRFHHGARGRAGNYSRSELSTWRRRIAAWRSRTKVYAYFNNDWEGFAVRNARDLQASFR